MVLTLKSDEVEIVRKALLSHIGELREQARRYSYTPTGITLCQQRAQAEELLDRLVSGPPPKLRLVA
jgi:hypothetical protein